MSGAVEASSVLTHSISARQTGEDSLRFLFGALHSRTRPQSLDILGHPQKSGREQGVGGKHQ